MDDLLNQLSVICKWAVAQGHRADDPTPAVRVALPRNGKHRGHFAALPHSQEVSRNGLLMRPSRASSSPAPRDADSNSTMAVYEQRIFLRHFHKAPYGCSQRGAQDYTHI